jgi:hypothetical protein
MKHLQSKGRHQPAYSFNSAKAVAETGSQPCVTMCDNVKQSATQSAALLRTQRIK